jgi:hypothetical protein
MKLRLTRSQRQAEFLATQHQRLQMATILWRAQLRDIFHPFKSGEFYWRNGKWNKAPSQ